MAARSLTWKGGQRGLTYPFRGLGVRVRTEGRSEAPRGREGMGRGQQKVMQEGEREREGSAIKIWGQEAQDT